MEPASIVDPFIFPRLMKRFVRARVTEQTAGNGNIEFQVIAGAIERTWRQSRVWSWLD